MVDEPLFGCFDTVVSALLSLSREVVCGKSFGAHLSGAIEKTIQWHGKQSSYESEFVFSVGFVAPQMGHKLAAGLRP